MKTNLKTQDHYTTYERDGQVVLAMNHEKILPENAPVRLTSVQLEELDYRNLESVKLEPVRIAERRTDKGLEVLNKNVDFRTHWVN